MGRYAMFFDGTASLDALRSTSTLVDVVRQVLRETGGSALSTGVSALSEDGAAVTAVSNGGHAFVIAWPRRRSFMFDVVAWEAFDTKRIRDLIRFRLGVCTTHRTDSYKEDHDPR